MRTFRKSYPSGGDVSFEIEVDPVAATVDVCVQRKGPGAAIVFMYPREAAALGRILIRRAEEARRFARRSRR